MKACNSCGKCCIKYSNGQLVATEQEIEYWDEIRPDIAEYVNQENIWSSPETGELLALCPWLRKEPGTTIYRCEIYDDRPDDCRDYPSNIAEMIRDECEMLEPRDLVAYRRSAQK